MRRAHGFSLLELILVVALIGVVLTMVPRFSSNGVSGAELRANVRAVAAGLRLTRDAAIRTRQEASLTLDLDTRTFVVPNDSREHHFHEKIDIKLFTAQADLVSEKRGAIRFYPDGSSNGGRVTVGAGGRDFAVDVDWLTGRVTITEQSGA